MNDKFPRRHFLLRLGALALITGLVGSSHLLAGQTDPRVSCNLILSSHRWIGSDGKPLPFQTDEKIIDFLLTAEVVKAEKIPVGVTKPQKLYLEKDGVKAAASFRDVDIHKKRWNDPNAGPRVDFRDSCVYECAAYRLNRLLGLNNIPPTVKRKVKGKNGVIQLWVEDAMMDTDRLEKKISPPDTLRWARQHQVMELWNQLVYNDDPNKGNVLIDPDWNIWFIDHTRCFRVFADIPEAEKIKYCERALWENLKRLDEETVSAELGDYLRSQEIKGLMKRLDQLIQHIQGLIDTRGEKSVLFEFRLAKTQAANR